MRRTTRSSLPVLFSSSMSYCPSRLYPCSSQTNSCPRSSQHTPDGSRSSGSLATSSRQNPSGSLNRLALSFGESGPGASVGFGTWAVAGRGTSTSRPASTTPTVTRTRKSRQPGMGLSFRCVIVACQLVVTRGTARLTPARRLIPASRGAMSGQHFRSSTDSVPCPTYVAASHQFLGNRQQTGNQEQPVFARRPDLSTARPQAARDRLGKLSGKDLLDDVAVDVGEAEV